MALIFKFQRSKSMFARVLLSSILIFSIFLFSGCAGTSTEQAKDEAAKAQTAAEQTPQNPCEAVIGEAVAEARSTMRVATKSCQEKNVEATPVWSLNYKGAVHVRVFDKNGTKIEDTIVNP